MKANILKGFFSGIDNIPIAWISYKQEGMSPAVVILHGKSASYIKYHEIAQMFYEKGFSVYLMDHRGMGFSGRMITNPSKVHVEKFDDYVTDVKTFFDNFVKNNSHSSYFLLAHSMGAGIAASYLENYNDDFDKAVLSSPMLQINTGFPESISLLIVRILTFLGFGKCFVFGQKNREFRSFEKSFKTSSKERFDSWKKMIEENPQIKSGGTTNKWLLESIKALRIIRKNADKIKTPILILQAGRDKHVTQEAIDEVLGKAVCGSKRLFPEAMHEILMECNLIRNEALLKILNFFQK